jgi:exopolyphosphatase
VVGVVDHHADAGLFGDAALRRVDPSAGSCCSLVAQLALEHGVALPPALATLLLGTILLDTRHFSEKAQRFSQVDVQAHRMLLAAHARDLPPEQEHAAWFEALMAARQDTGELSAADMLKLDTKSSVLAGGPFKGRRLAISSVMATLPELLERAGGPDALDREMRAFSAADRCDALVCLMSPERMEDGKKRKGLTLHGDKHLVDAVAKIVKDCPANLTEELRSNPLFAVQGILEKGFNPKPHPSLPPLPFWAMTLRGDTTRKTLMPTIVDLIGRL